VPADRLPGWVAGFSGRHGGIRPVATSAATGVLEVLGADGATAVLHAGYPAAAHRPPDAGHGTPAGSGDSPDKTPERPRDGLAEAVEALAAAAFGPDTVRVLLVRRGGYGIAVVTGSRLVATKVGSRYVQGRTAAGGWSQQRFARRRQDQADHLVRAAADVAVRLLLPAGADDALVTGGDRPLVEQVLADPRLSALHGLTRGPHLPVGDPSAALLKELPRRVRSVRVTISDG
jgi:hypothetical protein